MCERQMLWAIGQTELRGYRLRDWNSAAPSLQREFTMTLPDEDGHDRQPLAGGRHLSVTTGEHVWLFDRESRTFARHPQLGDLGNVKGVSERSGDGELAFVEAEGDHWWAERIHLLNPPATVLLPGEHLYKVRWIQ